MPPKGMSAAEIQKLVADKVAEALAADRAIRNDNASESGGQGGAPPVRECSFTGFMKCGPTQFHGSEGAVELCHWLEKVESTFGISECAERNKVKFAAATLQGRALIWWNSQVAALGLDVANGKPWTEVKKMMLEEFCPEEELSRLEDELRHLKLRDTNIAAFTQRFNELALLCPNAVPNEKEKIKLYIKGLPESIKGQTTSSKPTTLNEAIRMAHTLMEQKIQAEAERVAEGNKRRWENDEDQDDNNRHDEYNHRRQDGARAMIAAQEDDDDQEGPAPRCDLCGWCHFENCPITCYKCGRIGHKAKSCTRGRRMANGANTQRIRACYECGERDHNRGQCPKRNNQGDGNATGRAYAIGDVEQPQGPNVVTGNQE